MEYGNKLNPEHSLRTAKGIKGTRQKVIVTHNPSEIDQAQLLLVRFPNLGSDDAIICMLLRPMEDKVRKKKCYLARYHL